MLQIEGTMRDDYSYDKVRLTGLDGNERVGSMKDALSMLTVENPCCALSDKEVGADFGYFPPDDQLRALDTLFCINDLFQHGDYKGPRSYASGSANSWGWGGPVATQMNAVELLEHALVSLTRLNAECVRLREEVQQGDTMRDEIRELRMKVASLNRQAAKNGEVIKCFERIAEMIAPDVDLLPEHTRTVFKSFYGPSAG